MFMFIMPATFLNQNVSSDVSSVDKNESNQNPHAPEIK